MIGPNDGIFQNTSQSAVCGSGNKGKRKTSFLDNQWPCWLWSPHRDQPVWVKATSLPLSPFFLILSQILKLLLHKKPSPFFKRFFWWISAFAHTVFLPMPYSSWEKIGIVYISKSKGLHGRNDALAALLKNIIKVALYLVQVFFSFIKRNVVNYAGITFLQFSKCLTTFHLQKLECWISLSWLVN